MSPGLPRNCRAFLSPFCSFSFSLLGVAAFKGSESGLPPLLSLSRGWEALKSGGATSCGLSKRGGNIEGGGGGEAVWRGRPTFRH